MIYDLLQVWFNIIDHNMSIKGVKANISFPLHFVVGFYAGSEWGWTYIYLWCLNNGTLIIINH